MSDLPVYECYLKGDIPVLVCDSEREASEFYDHVGGCDVLKVWEPSILYPEGKLILWLRG